MATIAFAVPHGVGRTRPPTVHIAQNWVMEELMLNTGIFSTLSITLSRINSMNFNTMKAGNH